MLHVRSSVCSFVALKDHTPTNAAKTNKKKGRIKQKKNNNKNYCSTNRSQRSRKLISRTFFFLPQSQQPVLFQLFHPAAYFTPLSSSPLPQSTYFAPFLAIHTKTGGGGGRRGDLRVRMWELIENICLSFIFQNTWICFIHLFI